jgi:hypothetical protein
MEGPTYLKHFLEEYEGKSNSAQEQL